MQEFKSRLAKSLEYVLQDIFLLSSLKLYSICIHTMYYFAYVQYAGCAQHQMIHFLTLQAFAKRWHTRNVILPFYGNFPQKTLIQKSLISAFILEWHISQWDNVVNPKSFYF